MSAGLPTAAKVNPHRLLDHDRRIYPIKHKDSTAQAGPLGATNLLRRLRGHREDMLLFLSDMEVPFTKNILNQMVKKPKVKQKVLHQFQIFDDAIVLHTEHPYRETLRKHGARLCCPRWFNTLKIITLRLQRGKCC